MNRLIKTIVPSILIGVIFSGLSLANEIPESEQPGCDLPISPDNVCLKLEGNRYKGELVNNTTGNKLKVDLHFSKVTCVLTDPLHPERDVFRLAGELNKHTFSIDHGNYQRDCVTNHDKQIFNFHILTNDHIMQLDYARKIENPVLCDAAFGDVLCIEITDQKTKEIFSGVVEKK